MASGDTKTEALLNILGNGGSIEGISGCANTKTQNYIIDAINRIQDLEDELEELKNNPDVVDIVATYADLQSYDTSTLTDKDIIRVLQDSTHSDNSTYYRWNSSTEEFDFVGDVDTDAGANIIYLEHSPGTEPDPGDIKLYADAALTTELTGGDFWDILASGKPVMLRFNDISEDEFQTFSLLYSHLPSEKTILGFDDYAPEAYFFFQPGEIIYVSFGAGDPDVTGGFMISTQRT